MPWRKWMPNFNLKRPFEPFWVHLASKFQKALKWYKQIIEKFSWGIEKFR
jgi:hypothetical protein